MKTPQGQLRFIRIPNLLEAFHLKEVKPERLTEGVLPKQVAQR